MVPPSSVMRKPIKNNLQAAAEGGSNEAKVQRGRNRQKAVLPVRVCGLDEAGNSYSDLVHTLDITDTGVRLGAIRSNLQLGSIVTLQYKQHKAEFRVIWVSKRPCGREYQAGLQALMGRTLWEVDVEFKVQLQAQQETVAAGV